MNLNPTPAPPAVQILHGTVLGATATHTRYRLDNGRIGGPAVYLRPAIVADPDDPNTPAVPADGTVCLVVVIAGDLDRARVIPFQ